MKKENSALISAILTAAILVSASLIYVGYQLGGVDISGKVVRTAPSDPVAVKVPTAKVDTGDIIDGDPFLGDKDAPVTIIEWSDYECPFCGRFYDNTLPQIKKEYIDTGKVKLVFKDFPLGFHSKAVHTAIAAECAREQGDDATYFEFHDRIFENQRDLAVDTLKGYADEMGLDTDQFNNCLDSQKYADEVDEDMTDGQNSGISGTPGFLINGEALSGAQPFAKFKTVIDRALAN